MCEGRIPFSTTNQSTGYIELKDILTGLKVEDICLNKQDWRALGSLINESEYADAPDSSEYFNMQGMKIDVQSEGYKCMVEFLKTFPPEQMRMVNEYVWEQIHEEIVQIQARNRDHFGSSMTVYQFIKICLQICLGQNKPGIMAELDILSRANIGTWEGYSYFKEDLALYLSAFERAKGLGYGKADQVFVKKLVTNQSAIICNKKFDYPYGLNNIIHGAFRDILWGSALSLQDVLARIEYVYKQGPLMNTGHCNYPSTLSDVNSNILGEADRAARAAEMQGAQYRTNFAYRPSIESKPVPANLDIVQQV